MMTQQLRSRRGQGVLGSRGLQFAVLCVAALLVAACAAETDQTAGQEHESADVLAEMRSRHESASRVIPFETLGGLLENTEYQFGDEPPAPLTEAVIVGTVNDVQPGRGFVVEGNDAPGGTETSYDDPKAVWRTVHVLITVESVLSGSVERSPVTVGFAFGSETPFDDIKNQFMSFGRVGLFLNRTPVFSYDSSVYGTVLDGDLLALVDDKGRLELPVLSEDEEATYLRGASTVDELRARADEPKKVEQFDESGRPKD